MRPPTSANTPAAAPTNDRLTQAAWTTCRPAASASTPRRVSGADEITPRAKPGAATRERRGRDHPEGEARRRDQGRRGEVRIREARDLTDSETRGEAKRREI